MYDKFKAEKTKAIAITISTLFGAFIVLLFAVFYYKYENAIEAGSTNYQKRAEFSMHKVMEDFKAINDKNDRAQKQIFLNNISNKAYILKRDGSGIYRIDTTTDRKYGIADEFSDKSCGNGFYRHSFSSPYFYKEILSENRVFVCIFDKFDDYIVGFKTIYSHGLSSTQDSDFKEWLVKNLALTFVACMVCAFIVSFAFLWVFSKYFKVKQEYFYVKKESKKIARDIKAQLYIDPLTGLGNRAALTQALRECDKPKIIVIDIDDFSRMNDYYGKEICDKVIVYMANLIKEFAKNEGMQAFTILADQFVLLENGDFFIDRYEDLATELLGRFKGRLINIKDDDGNSIDIEIHSTIGFALDKDHTLMKATTALKVAKVSNKDFVCYFKGLNKKDEYANQIERSNLIRRAVVNNNIVPFYQPICDANAKVVKYECLIRIVESGDIVSPHIFLDISKRIKRYAELQKMVIQRAVEHLVKNENLVLSINLSARDMTDGNVSVLLLKLLNQHEVAERIIFEIVEDENIENVERVENFIDKVKNMGVKIAIDDFGSGYSNFSYILKLRPDYIKIDGSIIKNVDINNDSYMIARAIVTFAKDLGIKTIAEYIHSKEVFEVCKRLGVDEFQGFYLGMPTDKI
ncbi:EAL domain-containing protein [Campylobacter mucosalis]|uniref:Diguanylate cyclase/phosphodiesterase n=1 Tax=Campylobacter mucosalis CCUG 21559 TaxID=1032067 RepID=A0A6G5QGC0_9BACT|nr:GGDEF domain-containing phosphodiesterase [Campylobacter mucosalis]QCD44735.1 diguanylate cyclase/phosphodiesterase [Campylobacter mucosalis CCUG 21559]